MQICTRHRWRSAMFQKRRFRIVWSDSLNLPVLRLSKALKDAHSKELSNLHVRAARFKNSCWWKKSIILTPCTSTQRKFKNEQRKSYRTLISSCWTTDIRLFDFYGKRGHGPDQSHCNQSRLWSRLQTTLAHITRITPKWIYAVLNIFSPFTIFEQLALALKFFTILNVLFVFRIFNNLRLPWKQSLLWNISLYWNLFVIKDFWAASTCPEKQSPWNFLLYWISFLHSGVLSNLRLPEKLALGLKNRAALDFLKIFHCIEYTFYIRGFCNLRLPWKTERALNPLYWRCIFYYSGFLSNLRLPWKQSLPWNFSNSGARPTPASYAYDEHGPPVE